MKLFSKTLSSVLAKLQTTVDELETFIEENAERVQELRNQYNLANEEQARAQRVADKFKDLLN
jgi:outer membrane murein-binding lipoprotein Lpp